MLTLNLLKARIHAAEVLAEGFRHIHRRLVHERIPIAALNRERQQGAIELPPLTAFNGGNAPITAVDEMPRGQRLGGCKISESGAEACDDRPASAPSIRAAKQKYG